MNNQIFRNKTIDRISSVEEMHDYMRVTGPKLWMVLIVVLVLTAGGIIYACTVTMENKLEVSGEVVYYENSAGEEAYMDIELTIPIEKKNLVEEGMEVRIGGEEGKVVAVYTFEGQCFAGVWLNDDTILPKGKYNAEIVLESVSPMSFLFN